MSGMSGMSGSSSSSNPGSGVGLVNKPSLIEFKQYRFLITDAPSNFNLSSYISCLQRKHAVAVVRACEPTYDPKPLVTAGIPVLELPFNDGEAAPEQVLREWFQLLKNTFGEDESGSGTATGTAAGTNGKELHANGNGHPKHGEKKTNGIASSSSSSSSSSSASNPSTVSSSVNVSVTPNSNPDDDDASSSSVSSKHSPRSCVAVHCVAGLGRAPVLVCVALIECGMTPLNAIDFVRKKRRGAINTKQLKYLSSYKPSGALKPGKGKTKKEDGCNIM